jgi:predicted Zn-dependent protease
MSMIENFEKMLAAGKDSALLRFSLGNAYLQSEDQDSHLRAITHLREAVKHDSDYSAAWKLLGKAYIAVGDVTNAADAYREGIRAAE